MLIFGQMFDKMQFYFFGHIFQDIWNFLIRPEMHMGNIFRQMVVP